MRVVGQGCKLPPTSPGIHHYSVERRQTVLSQKLGAGTHVKPYSYCGRRVCGCVNRPGRHSSLPGILSPGQVTVEPAPGFPHSFRWSGRISLATCSCTRSPGISRVTARGWRFSAPTAINCTWKLKQALVCGPHSPGVTF